MIIATRKVAAEDVTEVMLLSEEKKWKRRTTEYVTYHNTMAALKAIITDSVRTSTTWSYMTRT